MNCGGLGFRVEGLGMFRDVYGCLGIEVGGLGMLRVYKGFSWFRPQPAPHFLLGFPKLEGTVLGVPVLRTRRIMVCWIYGLRVRIKTICNIGVCRALNPNPFSRFQPLGLRPPPCRLTLTKFCGPRAFQHQARQELDGLPIIPAP